MASFDYFTSFDITKYTVRVEPVSPTGRTDRRAPPFQNVPVPLSPEKRAELESIRNAFIGRKEEP